MANIQKSIFLVLTILACISTGLQGQGAQTIYVEGLGNGLFYSVNYDIRFNEGSDKWGARIGVAPYSNIVMSVLQVNYLIGAEKHKLELGAGVTAQFGFGSEKDRALVAPGGALMYRFQPTEGHFLFRVGLAPTFVKIDKDDTFKGLSKLFWVWPGASLGYKF